MHIERDLGHIGGIDKCIWSMHTGIYMNEYRLKENL